MPMIWHLLHRGMTSEHLGFIPGFLSEDDPRPAAEQINENYVFGGWRPFPGFVHMGNYRLKYPGDPVLEPLAMTQLRDEVVVFYPGEWLGIFQPDGSFEVSRVD